MRNGKLLRAAFRNGPQLVSEEQIDRLVEKARMWLRLHGVLRHPIVFGWSGGKDSVAVRYIIEPFKIKHVSTGAANFEFVEWREFVESVDTTVFNHPSLVNPKRMKRSMLFPTTPADMYSWFKMTNQYSWHASGVDRVIVGKRTQDGNCCGKAGLFTDRTGILQLSPIVNWKHEHVAALIHHKKLAMSPMYQWPDGFETTDKRWITRPVRAETKLDPLEYIGSLSLKTRERAEAAIKSIEWV